MNFKWIYKTSLKYSCDLKEANLEAFCKEWIGTASFLKAANQELIVSKVIHENKVVLKRLGGIGGTSYYYPDIKMTYLSDIKTIDFTFQIKKKRFFYLLIPFTIFTTYSLFSASVNETFLFFYDAKFMILGVLLVYILVLLYALYEEKERTKKDFEQELYYQRMKYEEL